MYIELIDSWNDKLNQFTPDKQDVYFSESYVKLYENAIDKAVCIVATDDDFCVLIPILRREIQPGYFDFETPYGYGGFIANKTDAGKINEAIEQIKNYLAQNNYVAGFIRFHPLLRNANMCREQVQVVDDRYTIAIDLKPDLNEIWLEQVHTKNRNTIRKAEKRGLTFVADHDFEYMDDFIRLYNKTMDKLGADNFYYFDNQYYLKWLETLKTNSFLAVVKLQDKVISACIVMYQKQWAHYHLSGSDRDFLNLEPNNFMLWNAAMELKKLGAEQFHLGGGIDANPENTLLKFKERFSTNKYMFSFGKMIFNNDLYNQLCMDWERLNAGKTEYFKHFLLKYRY